MQKGDVSSKVFESVCENLTWGDKYPNKQFVSKQNALPPKHTASREHTIATTIVVTAVYMNRGT